MKLIYLLLIITPYYSCTTSKKIKQFIPTEYFFPEDQLNKGKTFIYIDQSNGDSSFHDLYHYKKDNETYLIRTTYSRNEHSDSLIYLNYKLIEVHSYFFSKTQATKAMILSDTIIDNGRRLGKKYSDSKLPIWFSWMVDPVRIRICKRHHLSMARFIAANHRN